MYMNNEEIHTLIQQHQNAILDILQDGSFELNAEAAEHQQAILGLQHQCNHLDSEGQIRAFNGRCIYCGMKL